MITNIEYHQRTEGSVPYTIFTGAAWPLFRSGICVELNEITLPEAARPKVKPAYSGYLPDYPAALIGRFELQVSR